MAAIKVENIIGYYINGKVVCCDCVEDSELENIKQSDVIMIDDVEDCDTLYFCDGCELQIGL